MVTKEEEVLDDEIFDDIEDEIEDAGNGGNETTDEHDETPVIKTVKIGGHEVTAEFDGLGNIVRWEAPDGVEGKDLEKLTSKVNNYEGALANAQKDRLENKKLNQELKDKLDKLEKKLAEKPADTTTVKSPKEQAFGNLTWAEIDDLKVTDPSAYERGMDIYHDKLADEKAAKGTQQTRAELEESRVLAEIRATGIDPRVVQTWQKQFQMGSLQSAWMNYQAVNKPKGESPGERTQRKQAGSPTVVPKDTLTTGEHKYTREEAHAYYLEHHKLPPGFKGSIY